MLFFERGSARLGSVLQIFLDHRKSQKISNYLKKSQNISNLLEKTKNKKKTREHQIKLTQPYNNFAEASGRIAAQLSAVIIFPCVVKCWASMMKGFKTHLLVTWCIAMYCLITTGRSQSKKNQIKSNKFRYNQINDWIWGIIVFNWRNML